MSTASYFVAEQLDGRVVGTWPADEVRRRLTAGILEPTFMCLSTGATGDVRGQWQRLGDAFGPAAAGPAASQPPPRRQRWTFLWLAVGLLAAVTVTVIAARPGRHPPRPHAPPAPFTDFETAVAAQSWDPAWVVAQRPDHPGPFRLVGPTFSVGADPIYQAVVYAHDAAGRAVAPVELRGRSGVYQMAIHLETPEGQIVGAVLERPVDP